MRISDWSSDVCSSDLIEVKPGIWQRSPDAVLLGSHSRVMRVRVKGPFRMAGIVIRPSGWRALFPAPAHEFADDVAPLAEIWVDAVKRLGSEEHTSELQSLMRIPYAVF